MPNWTRNEVTFTSPFTNNIKTIKEIFEKGSPFDQLIKEPKWDEIPLKGNEITNDFRKKLLGKKSIQNLNLNLRPSDLKSEVYYKITELYEEK